MGFELKCGQRSALIARARFVNPDMNRNAGIMRLIYRRERSSPIDASEPASIAMGKHIQWAAFECRRIRDYFLPVISDQAARLHIIIGQPACLCVGGGNTLGGGKPHKSLSHLLQRS